MAIRSSKGKLAKAQEKMGKDKVEGGPSVKEASKGQRAIEGSPCDYFFYSCFSCCSIYPLSSSFAYLIAGVDNSC
nr:hypothetical protein CFP56_78138 [Quercus suber]